MEFYFSCHSMSLLSLLKPCWDWIPRRLAVISIIFPLLALLAVDPVSFQFTIPLFSKHSLFAFFVFFFFSYFLFFTFSGNHFTVKVISVISRSLIFDWRWTVVPRKVAHLTANFFCFVSRVSVRFWQKFFFSLASNHCFELTFCLMCVHYSYRNCIYTLFEFIPWGQDSMLFATATQYWQPSFGWLVNRA